MSKYTLAQILEAWEAAYGEDMHEEYPGFIQRLSEETDKETDWSTKRQASSLTIVRNGIIKDVERRKYANNKKWTKKYKWWAIRFL